MIKTINEMNLVEITTSEKEKILKEFIDCFKENGKEKNYGKKFEIFLGIFLQSFGFDEVCVTKYSGDGGIDLTATRKGFDIKGSDSLNYYIQAKCYAFENKIRPCAINELRGSVKKDKAGNVLNNNCINIFITTSTYTKEAIRIAEEDIHRPVILIDGFTLIDMCIQKGIGFDFKPVFAPNEIKEMINKPVKLEDPHFHFVFNFDDDSVGLSVEKTISQNDVRARILPLPQLIKNSLKDGQDKLSVTINHLPHQFNIDKTRRYLGGVTELYKKFGMINADGTYKTKTGKWFLKDEKIHLAIE